MGGGSSKSSKKRNTKNPVQQNWQVHQQGQLYNIVKNKTDGRQAQQYRYILDNRYDPSNQTHIFDRRNKTNLPLVRSFDHQWQTKGSGLVPANNFRVVTERLPHRLTNCPQLSFDQSLYILDRALQGYNFLYNSIGPFDINSNMIGFTAQGQVRVWHNQNFGKNYPYHQKRTLQSTRIDQTHKYDTQYAPLQQVQMVRNLINVIQDRCEEGVFPQDFRSKIRQNIGFIDARKLVQQQLDAPQRVRINRIDLWRNLVKSKITNVGGQTLGQTNLTYGGSTIPIHATTSVLQPNPISTSQYQNQFVPSNQPSKHAFSFSYQKPVPV